MKTAQELVHYTHRNGKAMREWWNYEYKHAAEILNKWIKEYRIENKKDNELVNDIAVYDLEGGVIVENYMKALLKCHESYTQDTVIVAIDILLQEMAEELSEHMRIQYPCLGHTHYVIMRANRFMECIMYIGPYYSDSETACYLFGDGGVFMSQGADACIPLFGNIGLFQ